MALKMNNYISIIWSPNHFDVLYSRRFAMYIFFFARDFRGDCPSHCLLFKWRHCSQLRRSRRRLISDGLCGRSLAAGSCVFPQTTSSGKVMLCSGSTRERKATTHSEGKKWKILTGGLWNEWDYYRRRWTSEGDEHLVNAIGWTVITNCNTPAVH